MSTTSFTPAPPKPKKVLGSDLVELSVDNLFADHTYLRNISQKKVDAIVAHWDDNKVNPPVVNERASGDFVIVDGQHLIEAARELDYTHVKARLVDLADRVSEARLARDLNIERRRPTTQEVHRANLAASETLALVVEDLLGSYGLTARHTSAGNEVRAVATMRRAWGKDGATNDVVLNPAEIKAGQAALKWVLDCLKPLLDRGENPGHVVSMANLQALLWVYHHAQVRPTVATIRRLLTKTTGKDLRDFLSTDACNPFRLAKSRFRGIQLSVWLNDTASKRKSPQPIALDAFYWSAYVR